MTARPHANQVPDARLQMPLQSSDARELLKLRFIGIQMLVLFQDCTEEGGLPSIKLAVYSNIQLNKCQRCELLLVKKFKWFKISLVGELSAVVIEC